MKWHQNKTNKKVQQTPFLVLPKIEVLCVGNTKEMPKNPGLRLFTKAWQPQKEPEKERPLTATLEKPQILNINLISKIDMSLIRKEFLCITNLCRVPLSALSVSNNKVRRKPPAFNQNRRCPLNRPLSLPSKVQLQKSSRPCTSEDSWEDERSSSSQTFSSQDSKKLSKMNKIKSSSPYNQVNMTKPSRMGAESDANNNTNNFKTYRIPKSRTVRVSVIDKTDRTAKLLPQPCNTCGRADQPERFHSHPEAPPQPPKKMNEKVSVTKNTVQKPVAIKYKSKLNEKRKTVVSPVKKSVETSTPNTRDLKKNDPIIEVNKRVASGKGPRTLTCYICGREFGTMSLPLHEPKCMEKWERENSSLPSHLQRKRPVKPDHTLTKNEWNAYAWESSQANLVPCQNCGRTFYPDRLIVHQRSCKPKESSNMAKYAKEEVTDTPPGPAAKPRSVPCNVCGRLFGTKSIKIHEPQCLKKWHLQNDNLPAKEREPMFRDIETPAKPQQQSVTPPQVEKTSSASKKPPMFPCYLCGRLFSVNSIYIHEPQCLKKWKAENDKLPPHKRRAEPLKPDIKFTPDGKVDHQAMTEANWLSHLEQLVPCKACGRTFNPDRVEVHERSCKGQSRKFQDISVEILQ